MTQITLATLPQATAQQVFDQVATHMLTQGQQSRGDDGCRYRDGPLKCAAGCLIADDEYAVDFEDTGWRTLVERTLVPSAHEHLIAKLQCVHDFADPEDWLERLACLAQEHRLYTTALQPWIQVS